MSIAEWSRKEFGNNISTSGDAWCYDTGRILYRPGWVSENSLFPRRIRWPPFSSPVIQHHPFLNPQLSQLILTQSISSSMSIIKDIKIPLRQNNETDTCFKLISWQYTDWFSINTNKVHSACIGVLLRSVVFTQAILLEIQKIFIERTQET